MDIEYLKHLEAASQVILSPNNDENRKEAELVFLKFRSTKAPYNLCKFILETSTLDYVLFETAGTLREAIVREWYSLDRSHISEMRQYLLHYVLNHPNLVKFVSKRIIQIVIIMVKRTSVSDNGAERSDIIKEIEQLIVSNNGSHQQLGCSLLSIMLSEYATTVKSSDVGLTWEDHIRAKEQLEASDLKRIFEFCVNLLNESAADNIVYGDNVPPVLKELLMISEAILSWRFSSTSKIPKKVYESLKGSDENKPIYVPSTWKDVFTSDHVITLFFTLHWKVRMCPIVSQYSMNCLVQLASLHGPTLFSGSVKDQIDFFSHYIHSFHKYILSAEIQPREALGVSYVIHKLVQYSYLIISQCPDAVLFTFLEDYTKLTCQFADYNAREEKSRSDDKVFTEAFDLMLEDWSMFYCASAEPRYKDYMENHIAVQIFNKYLRVHLQQEDPAAIEEEVDEIEENDVTRFSSQLQTIGAFSRMILHYSLPLLSKLIEERTIELNYCLKKINEDSWDNFTSEKMNQLYEDIHWLIMIAGHTLNMEGEGELLLIPKPIITFSQNLFAENKTDVDISLQLLTSPNSCLNETPNAEITADPVIRLISAIFRLSELERQACVVPMLTDSLSPQIAWDIVWLLCGWAQSYLLIMECSYTDLSIPLVSALGLDTPCVSWIVNFLLQKIYTNLTSFSAEKDVICETINLFHAIVASKEKAEVVVSHEYFWKIIALPNESQNSEVYNNKKLYRVISSASSAFDQKPQQNEYWIKILEPIQEKFKSIASVNFRSNLHNTNIRTVVVIFIEKLIGLVQGVVIYTAQTLFALINGMMNDIISLISLFRNYQQIVILVLELFEAMGEKMLGSLSVVESKVFYSLTAEMIKAYSQINEGRLFSMEEPSFSDIEIFLYVLFNMAEKDVSIWRTAIPPLTQQNYEVHNPNLNVEDCIILGLKSITPLLSVDLLRFPSLGYAFYQLISYFSDLYGAKLCFADNEQLLKTLLSTVELGIIQLNGDVIKYCFEFVQNVGCHINELKNPSLPGYILLKPFLKLVIDLILSRFINSEQTLEAGETLYVLICLYYTEYQSLVEQLVTSQPDREVAGKLVNAFDDLTNQVIFDSDDIKHRKVKFGRENFLRFIASVHGFLIVK